MIPNAQIHKNRTSGPKKNKHPANGFTLIELMIVIAVIAIILTLAIPTYKNFTIRAKIAEALSVSNSAKTAVASACQELTSTTTLTNALAGYSFQASKYVSDITLDGPCSTPTITITTFDTGAQPDPVLTITGDFTMTTGQVVTWVCVSNGPNIHVPEACRS
jgi:type IV pilus assembly protein PilA